MASLALAFDILARDKSATSTFNKVGDSAEKAGKKGMGFGTAIKGAMGVAAGAIAAAGIGRLITDAIGEAREAQKVGALTAQVIKTTGGAAKISAKQVGDLAEAISNKSGVDDEAVQTGANLLLTFKNVRNEAGKGSDVFNRATQAAVDLSAAGFGSVDGAAKMLGKALNDPLKGISALGRAGVTFTAGQKKQIEAMVKAGDVLGAQKIIMGEVESQVGGAAAASATAGEKMAVAWGNFKEQIGEKLLPILDRFATWFVSQGLPALERFGGWLQEKVMPPLSRFGEWFTTKGLPAVQKFGGWLKDELWPALKKGYDEVLPAIKSALDTVGGGLEGSGTSFRDLGNIVTQKVIPVLTFIIKNVLPVVAANLRTLIEVIKATNRFYQAMATVAAKAFSVIVGAIIGVTKTFQSMLRALGNVPGFEWAKTAADKMGGPIAKLHQIKNGLDAIPNQKNITIGVSTKLLSPGRINVGGQLVNVGMRAAGGPVAKGQPYIVGERRPELFVPNQSGTIVPRVPADVTSGGTPAGPQITQLVVDGRVLAEVVNGHNASRRG